MDTFTVWATSDAHVIGEALAESCDPRAVPRESLAIALEQADGPEGFFCDIGLHLGDLLDYGHETLESFHRYLAQLDRSAKGRHAWYHAGGNNDENSVLNDGVAIDNEYYFVDDPLCAGESRFYRAFAYNAGSGRIRYCQSAPRGADVTG